MVESSDKKHSTGEGNGKPLQYSCLENTMNSMKTQKDMTWEDKTPKSIGIQYATRGEQRNSSRKNEENGPKEKMLSCGYVWVVKVKFDAAKNNIE